MDIEEQRRSMTTVKDRQGADDRSTLNAAAQPVISSNVSCVNFLCLHLLNLSDI